MADSAQDRQLPATQRKITKARTEGQVARSRDLGHFGAIGAGVAVLAYQSPEISRSATRLLNEGLRFDAAPQLPAGYAALVTAAYCPPLWFSQNGPACGATLRG